MKRIAVTQRVDILADRGERRDALDQRWATFLSRLNCFPILVPNNPTLVTPLFEEVGFDGILMTGGNDLASYGGDAPERDETERALIKLALSRELPVIGVCRGMSVVQDFFGVPLKRVSGHVAPQQLVTINGVPETVNSYHNFAATETVAELQVWATAEDGVVEAVRHERHPIVCLMWHPERLEPFVDRDLDLFAQVFGVER